METLQAVQPKQKATEIWHTFFKKDVHSFFSAKDDTYINESKYGNHLEAVTYWENVKKAANDL